MAKIKITLRKSLIGSTGRQKAIAKSLGLTKIDQTVEHEDSVTILGMVNRLAHLVVVEK